jgi:hypothetical protein
MHCVLANDHITNRVVVLVMLLPRELVVAEALLKLRDRPFFNEPSVFLDKGSL